MYPVTTELAELFANQRQVVKLTFDSVADSIVLTEADIKSGGLVIDRTCVSGDSIEIGSVIASELGVQLNNTSGQFNDVTLEGAECFVEVGTKDWSDEQTQVQYIPMGYFTVDGSPRKLDTISFKALDRMVKFDRPVDFTQLSFPMTVSALLSSICTICGVTLNTEYQSTWVNKTRNIPVAPEGDNLTYRQLLSWICEIMGVCAYMSPAGTLNLHWYGQTQSSTPSITAGVRYNSDIQENAITLTGVRVVKDDTVYLAGTDSYALTIEGNALLQSGYQTVANNIYNARGGLTYTPFTATVKSMPHIYPLDTINFVKGEDAYPSIITNANYALNNSTVLEGKGQTQIENDYAELNPMTTQQTVVLNRLHSKTVQEFKVADGEVLSTIANSQDKYDESASPGTITLRGYSTPADAGYAAAEHSGEYYLNETNGYVYLSNGTSWSKVAELTLKTTELDTKIDQTATRISSEANARLEATVGYSSKNLLELSATTTTKSGIAFTVDKTAGTVTANGTCTASNYTTLTLGYVTNNTSTPLDLYMSGCADGGANDKYYLYAQDSSVEPVARLKKWDGVTQSESVIDSTTSAEIQIPAGHTGRLLILVRTGITVTDIVFRPMTRDGSITDNTFEPFKATVQTQINEANSTIIQTAHGITQTVAAANAVEYIIPPGVIVNYHGYGFAQNGDGTIDYTTTDTGISASGNSGKYFLDQSTGMLYVSDGNTWNNNNKQQLPTKFSEYKTASQTSSEINQTASAISMEVVGNTVGYSLSNDFTPVLESATVGGLTITKQADGSYIANGTASGNEGFYLSTLDNQYSTSTPKYFTENGQYTIKATGSSNYALTIFEDLVPKAFASTTDVVVTIANVATKTNCVCLGFNAGTYTDVVIKPVICKGVSVEEQLNDTKTLIEQTADGILLSASQMISGKRTINLIPFVYNGRSSSAVIVNGIKLTRNNYGFAIWREASSSSDAYFTVYTADCNMAFNNSKLADVKTLPTGKYIVSGSFNNDIQYRIEYSTNGSTVNKIVYLGENNDTTEKTFEITDNMTYVRHYIWIRAGASFTEGIILQPMIRDATITDSTYSPGMDAGAYMCSAINITPERLELDSGKLIINSGNFQLDGNGVVTSTAGTFKSGNYSPATQSVKTVGGQLDLDASGSELIVDTANFKVSGNGAVSAEDATFTNCTIEGGSFEVDSTEQSGQVTNRITLNNSYLGDRKSVNISAEQIELSRSNTGASGSIWLDNANALSGSAIHISSQHGTTYDKAVYSADSIKFDVDTVPNTANISYVDANSNEFNALVFGGSPSTVTLGDKDTITKILGTRTYISFIDSNNVEHLAFSYIGVAMNIGNPDIPVLLSGSRVNLASPSVTINDRPVATSAEIEARLEATVGHSSKNLLPITLESGTYDSDNANLSYVVDKVAGTITINGNTRTSGNINLPIYEDDNGIIAGKLYISGGYSSRCRVLCYDYTSLAYVTEWDGVTLSYSTAENESKEFMPISGHRNVYRLQIGSGQTFDNVVIKPMLRDGSISDDTFEPYVTPTDERIASLEAQVAALTALINGR